ncbi:hypothetical protein JCM5353_004194 [Sporobolomyces roseus]
MSQQYPNYRPQFSQQPLPPHSQDDYGFQHNLAGVPLHHSSSSIYDDPEEMDYAGGMDEEGGEGLGTRLQSDEAMGGVSEYAYAPDPYSSPTPSSSNAPSFVSQLRPQPASNYSSQYSRVESYYAPVPVPPQPDFTRKQQQPVASTSSSSSRSAFASYRPPLPQYQDQSRVRPPQIARPQPIRAMPVRTNSRPNSNRQIASNQQNNDFSGALPNNVPLHSYNRSQPQQGMGSISRTQNNLVQGDRRALESRGSMGTDEAEYWGDEGLDEVVMQIRSGPQEARLPQQQRPRVVTQEPQVQYYDDLVPQDEPNASTVGQPRNAPSSNRSSINKKSIKLKPINLLPDAFRSIWRFGVFNAVQSCCFDSVYGSDENVVVSAPTGAGKTVLFELAILRLFSTSTSSQSKVLYMAPTKSLCSERAVDWKKKFERGLGWKVTELTGDSEIGSSIWREVASSRIIVTTPEKWDALTRRWHDHDPVLSELRLFCVDEVHSVGADVRGAVLEVVVSRMKTLGTSTRFVAVSATVPNIKDVSEWLSNPDEGGPATIFEFGDEFRPCPLQKIVYGFNKNNNDFAFVKTLNTELFKIIKKHSSGNPVLIFCSTRKSCLEAAEQLVKDYKEALNSSSRPASLAWPKPPRTSYTVNDKRLAALIESGVSTHHAGMDQQDRKLVEKLFLEGKISIICSTSTLAVGVNLPARMVIIRGTKGYAEGRMSEYPDMEVLQMLGRAGRPQFDRLGVACIMTDKESQHRYENLVNAQKKLESCLHKNLTEHINSEIALRTITDRETALRFLHSTFLYVRITKNPTYYAIANSTTLSPDARLEEICVEAIKQLVSEGIVVEEEDESLAPNEYGEVMSRFYISHPTFVALKSMSNGVNMRTLLETLAKAEEFSSFRIRQGEKSVLAKVNKNLRFPTEKVASTADRVMILIQVVLEGIPGTDIKTDSVNPLLDINAIWSPAVRIAKALFDLAVLRKDGSARIAMELLRSLNGRCWDGTSFTLRQLKGIGEKSYKALVDAGIRSFADVASASPDRLELILNRKPPYGSQLADQAKMFPKFQVCMNIESEEVRDDGVEVEVKIDLSLEKTKPLPIVKRGNINLYASVLVLTSDGHFIEFRRCPLSAILKGSMKPFSVSVILVKPSQRVVTSVSCDVLAGSEVRADVKPSTRACDFPIPSLASEPDANEVEITATSSTTERSMPAAISSKFTKKRPAPAQSDDEDQEESAEPRQRDDGKFECNHACKDKTKCKHLCCREGLDKPPRKPPANKKRKVSNPSRSNSLDTPSTSTKKRIPMAASNGVTLVQDAQGRVVTKTKSKSTGQSKSQNVSGDDTDDDFELPTPDQLASGNYQKKAKITKKAIQKKKVVAYSNPSPPSPDPFAPSKNDTNRIFVPRPPAPQVVKKKAPTTSKSTLAMNRSSKVCLKEFDSSESEVDELDEPIGKRRDVVESQGKGKEKDNEEEEGGEPLFRSPSTSDQDFFAQIDSAALSGGRPEKGGDVSIGDGDQLEVDTALALAKSFEDSSTASQIEANAEVRGNEEGRDEKEKGGRAIMEKEESENRGVEVSEVVEEKEEEEDDGFEAWLAGNVDIHD